MVDRSSRSPAEDTAPSSGVTLRDVTQVRAVLGGTAPREQTAREAEDPRDPDDDVLGRAMCRYYHDEEFDLALRAARRLLSRRPEHALARIVLNDLCTRAGVTLRTLETERPQSRTAR
jgi:hypothetical protein